MNKKIIFIGMFIIITFFSNCLTPNKSVKRTNTTHKKNKLRYNKQQTTYSSSSSNQLNSSEININPYNVNVPENKSIWTSHENGKTFFYKKEHIHIAINPKGEIVTKFPSKVRIVGSFSEGLYPVYYKEKKDSKTKYGFMNTQAKLVIPAKYTSAEPFSNGLAAVKINKKYGYINKQGRMVIQPQFTTHFSFIHHDYTFVKKKGDEKYRVLSRNGHVSKAVFSFHDIYEVTRYSKWAQRQAFNSKLIRVEKSGLRQGRYFRFKIGEKIYGFRNVNGKLVIPIKYGAASTIRHGIITVGNSTKKGRQYSYSNFLYGAIKANGKTLLPMQFKSLSTAWANSFENDNKVSIAGVHKTKGCVIYNDKGKAIFGPVKKINGKKCLKIWPFKHDLARVSLHGGYGIEKGHKVILHGKTVFINRKGKVVINIEKIPYFLSRGFNRQKKMFYCDDNFGVVKNVTCGFMDINGKIILSSKKRISSRSYEYKIGRFSNEFHDDQYEYISSYRVGSFGRNKETKEYFSDFGIYIKHNLTTTIGHKSDWSTNLYPFCKGKYKNQKCGFIDLSTDKVIVPLKWNGVKAFQNGISIIENAGYEIIREEFTY